MDSGGDLVTHLSGQAVTNTRRPAPPRKKMDPSFFVSADDGLVFYDELHAVFCTKKNYVEDRGKKGCLGEGFYESPHVVYINAHTENER